MGPFQKYAKALLSCVMRSSALIHICEKKGADQLHDNRTADQPLCFHFTDNTIPLLPDPKLHSSS